MTSLYRMFTLSNGISLLRAPLALLFIIDNAILRTVVILLSMLTDYIDGYLARRYQFTSRLGAALDPIMDKFFVFTALIVLIFEHKIKTLFAISMISRDLFLFLFGFMLLITGKLKTYEFRAIRWGKITTAMQFLTLIAIVLNFSVPLIIYGLFVLFSIFAFIELILRDFRIKKNATDKTY